MSVYKDTKNNTWKVYYRFTDWQGKVHQSTKRGFPTKREALAWEREQLHKVEADLDMWIPHFPPFSAIKTHCRRWRKSPCPRFMIRMRTETNGR